jgi:3-oxoacyl-[acyl-carrier protein] reductase
MPRTVVVTGTSRGLGLSIAQRLLDDGYRVIGMSRQPGEFSALLGAHEDRAVFLQFDLDDLSAIPTVVKEITATSGPVWGLVNNAGIGLDGVLATMHQSDIDRVIRTNLTAPIVLTKYVVRAMLSRGEGRIINISSIIASTGFNGLSVYAATKAALEGFTRSLSREVGKRAITVNAVAPGFMETEMTQSLQGEKLEAIRRRATLGLPTTVDAAAAVAFLLGDEAARISGAVLTVDGGSTA